MNEQTKKSYYQEHKEERKEYRRKYYQEHKEEISRKASEKLTTYSTAKKVKAKKDRLKYREIRKEEVAKLRKIGLAQLKNNGDKS